ncbi:hypothetical protein ACFQ21_19570 [Ohtaekwangia kribbensis]|uniref:AraC family transcriptional regulator n=1 Tax=Ohtaekwangia kribbensis TaxID=688913 RepID=A0ABW3K6C3_9BACT
MKSLINFLQSIVALNQLRGIRLSSEPMFIRNGALATDFYFVLSTSMSAQSLYATSKI